MGRAAKQPEVSSVSLPVILSGPAAEKEIRRYLQTCTRARLAVAYWGAGAVSRLGIEKAAANKSDIEVTCDVLSGACNPDEIQALRDVLGERKIRHRDGLHCKVWITDKGCVLGSSNASANGLGHEDEETANLIEANLAYTSPSAEALAAWNTWYEQDVRRNSDIVTNEMLSLARERWLNRRATRDGLLNTRQIKGSLLAKLTSDPAYFRDKPLMVGLMDWGDMSDAAGETFEAAKVSMKDEDLVAYEDWQLNADTYVLEFTWNPKTRKAKLPGLYQVIRDRPRRKFKGGTITLAREVPSFDGLTLESGKREFVKKIADIMQAVDGEELFVTAEDFGRRLAEL